MNSFEEALRANIDGEIHFDAIHRRVYSVDASIYEIEPVGIVVPKTKQALIKTIQICHHHHIPVIPRGAATGITGGCLGKGLIIDTSKYLNHILEIDYEKGYAICEPGVVQDRLNEALAAKGYRLGPDTSTGNRATLGGMVANNSAGARSLLYGTMYDHVLETELVLGTGEILHLRSLSLEEWKKKAVQSNLEGHIYRELFRIREQYRSEIGAHFPNIPRRVSGYNIHSLLDSPFNPSKLIVGSEGSLGLTTEIKVQISPKPAVVGLCVIHLKDMFEAMKRIEELLAFHPIAIEMIDHRILEAGMQSPSMRGKLGWLTEIPDALFMVEFEAKTALELLQKIDDFTAFLKQNRIGYAYTTLLDPVLMSHIWEVRKSGLGLLLSKRSYSRAIAFLEDLSIPPKQLGAFMEKFNVYLKSHNKQAGIYGHVGSGCMHIRPYIDLCKTDDLKLMQRMMEEISDLVLAHGGALSGEHGDGLIRSWLNEKMFGKTLYQAFVEIKTAFDPDNLMNPGKVVHGPPLLQNLRIDPQTNIQPIDTFLDFSQEGGFALAADLCNGNGLCRKSEKLMCPSFQATGDEFHTTRARAQALRAIVNGKVPIENLSSQDTFDVLDLCLECKGCKTECPSEVDMAKMKTEFLYHYYQKHATPLRNYIFSHIGTLNKLGSYAPSLFNRFSKSWLAKKFMGWIGISPSRTLPSLANKTFSTLLSKSTPSEKPSVVLFSDTFTEFNEPQIGVAAVQVLEKLGYHVIVPEWQCCGRPALSKGRLPQAQKMAKKLIQTLLPFAHAGMPIIGLEPSCLFTIKEDYQGLVGSSNSDMKLIKEQCTTFDLFVAKHLIDGKLPFMLNSIKAPIKLHGHCHQKALEGTKYTLSLLKAIPGSNVTEIPSGCCGMAGSFGYEQEHEKISLEIAELQLLPAIRASTEDTILVANGISCRSQIRTSCPHKVLHIAEVLASLL